MNVKKRLKGIICVIMAACFMALPLSAYATASDKELAKGSRLFCTKVCRGISTTITLPSSKTFHGGGDFINTYIHLSGFECGISSAYSEDFRSGKKYMWHWFVGGPEPIKNANYKQFNDGEKVDISLRLNGSNHMEFYVNGNKVFESTKKYTSDNEARIVIACTQSVSDITKLPNKFEVYHNQIAASKIKYMNNSGSWVNLSWESTKKPENFLFPTGSNSSKIKDTREYVAVFDGTTFYASYKKI